VLLAACGAGGGDESSDAGPSSTTPPAVVEEPSESPSAETPSEVSTAEDPTVWTEGDGPGAPEFTPGPPTTWDNGAADEALEIAEQVLTAQLDTDRHEDEWWEDWSQYLSPHALELYQFVPPEAIAPATITGPAVLNAVSEPSVALVDVPTDLGMYRIVLTRLDGAAPWLVDAVTPPEGLG
jgi:hypothetical protein